jgi:RHS repeat-associated protein
VPQQFTGKEIDPETGLYYYGARYYDPRTQQWQTPDPIVGSYLNGGPNQGVYNPVNLALYTYGNNNPVRYTDPSGLEPGATDSSSWFDEYWYEQTFKSGSSSSTSSSSWFDEYWYEQTFEGGYSTATGQGVVEYGPAGEVLSRVEVDVPIAEAGVPSPKLGLMARFKRSIAGKILDATMRGKSATVARKTGSDGVDVKIETQVDKLEKIGKDARLPGELPPDAVPPPDPTPPEGGGTKLNSGLEGPGFFSRAADFLGKAALGAAILDGLLQDYKTYQDAKANGRSYGEEVEHRRNEGRSTIMVWPFPGFVIPGNNAGGPA